MANIIAVALLLAVLGGMIFMCLQLKRRAAQVSTKSGKVARIFATFGHYRFLDSNPLLISRASARVESLEIYGPSFAAKAEALYSFTTWDKKTYRGYVIVQKKHWDILKQDLPIFYSNENPQVNVVDHAGIKFYYIIGGNISGILLCVLILMCLWWPQMVWNALTHYHPL